MDKKSVWEVALCVESILSKGLNNSETVKRIIKIYHLGEKPRKYLKQVIYSVYHC